MAKLEIELSSETFQQLQQKADQLGTSPAALAQDWLIKNLKQAYPNSIKRADLHQILAENDLLAESDSTSKPNIAKSLTTLEQVQAWLTPGKPLSEIVIDQRETSYIQNPNDHP